MSKKTEKLLVGLMMLVAAYVGIGGLLVLSERLGISESSAAPRSRDAGGSSTGGGGWFWNGATFIWRITITG